MLIHRYLNTTQKLYVEIICNLYITLLRQDPNQLIYAELDIKTQPVVQTNKTTGKKLIENPDKTEYAEILYVSPQTSASKDGSESEHKSKEIEIK